MSDTTTAQSLLGQLRAGDPAAREKLIATAQRRFVALARAMLRRYPHLRRWEETDDVLQAALMRLYRSLGQVQPESLAHFDSLAATQIRRELIDLARSHFGPEGDAVHHHTDGANPAPQVDVVPDAAPGPETLQDWTSFHEAVDHLPEPERLVVDLIWYRGLTHAQAAETLGVATKTVQRRWASARLLLQEALHGESPRPE